MYPVDLHMHTVASTHAYSTLHDYIAEAKRRDQAVCDNRSWPGHGGCPTPLALY
ncbi:Probable phosphatase YcdX [Yokenella regensburgei]|nr:Probable phosphatase YcdX [Yokenella regensburgei]